MSAVEASAFLVASAHADVAVLRWPEQRVEVARLEKLQLPRLLLVELDDAPPECESCLEDWIRLPASESDLRSRLASLRRHATRHPHVPTLDSWGQLTYRDVHVLLSPLERAIAAALVAQFEVPVRDEDLVALAWAEGDGSGAALRVHAARLRKRLKPAGLELTSVRGYGYMLRPAA